MKLKRYFVITSLLIAAILPASAQNMFMKVMDPGQILGESLAQDYVNWTELTGFNGGSSSTAPIWGPGNPQPGLPVTKCFTISMRQDRMAYYLKKEMYGGSFLTSVQIDMVKNTGQSTLQTYYRLQMENVFVSLIEEAASEDGFVTMNVSFNPERFRYTYWPQNSNGQLGTPVIFGWNVRTNQTW